MDPSRIDIRGSLCAGRDCIVDVNVVFEGEVTLGQSVRIGSGCVIRNSTLGDGVNVEPMRLHRRCSGGGRLPDWSIRSTQARHTTRRVRPDRQLRGDQEGKYRCRYQGCPPGLPGRRRCGAKGATSGPVPSRATTTASTSTAPKSAAASSWAPTRPSSHRCAIEDGAYIGAGSTITSKVGRGDLAVGRGRQRNIKGWTPPAKRQRRDKPTEDEG